MIRSNRRFSAASIASAARVAPAAPKPLAVRVADHHSRARSLMETILLDSLNAGEDLEAGLAKSARLQPGFFKLRALA